MVSMLIVNILFARQIADSADHWCSSGILNFPSQDTGRPDAQQGNVTVAGSSAISCWNVTATQSSTLGQKITLLG